MKPVKIKNPTSMQHLVRIRQGQSIHLQLDENLFPNHKIRIFSSNNTYLSDNLTISEQEQLFNCSNYSINLNKNIEIWAQYSSVYLGEIWIDSQKEAARLLIVMESSSEFKSNFITTINPDYADIRITPGDIMEVILFNIYFGDNYIWEWQFNQETDCDVELLGTSDLNLQICQKNKATIDCPELPYARFPRVETIKDPTCYQKHFWFRFDKKMLSLVDEMTGVSYLGDFKFLGSLGPNSSGTEVVQRAFSVHAILDKKYKMRMFHSLLLPKLNEKNNSSSFVIPTSVRNPNTHNKKQIYIIRDIEIKPISFGFIDQGCHTKTAEPPLHKSSLNYQNSSNRHHHFLDTYTTPTFSSKDELDII
jgi:hypothetical protein